MTFPENENIQGLRAYSPTQPSDLEKFEVVHNALDPKARIEQVEAVNLDELPGNCPTLVLFFWKTILIFW